MRFAKHFGEGKTVPYGGSWRLGEFRHKKIGVVCACGVKRRYDVDDMLERVRASTAMPDLLKKIAVAEGCQLTENRVRDRCQLAYAPAPEILAKE